MPDAPDWRDPAASMAAHNLLQQQLITVRARLDRQIAQLIRLNKLSNHLIDRVDRRPVAEIFAEASAGDGALLDRRPAPDAWSVAEVIHHVADAELAEEIVARGENAHRQSAAALHRR